MNDVTRLVDRLEILVDRVEELLPRSNREPDWSAVAYRWRNTGPLQAIRHPHLFQLDDLLNVDGQKQQLLRNTRQFIDGLPANNALLWGSRGTGKSSLVKAMLTTFSHRGLRLIEVEKQDLIHLPDIVDPLYGRDEWYIIFSDDLSFEANDPSFKALKAILEGSVAATPNNVLIYATSNRRHLIPEMMRDNLDARQIDGEIHHSEAVEEKISLSERFGIWLSFYPFKQDEYLNTVFHWIKRMDGSPKDFESVRTEALRWALGRGSRSGRVAYQFARDWAGRTRLSKET